MYRLLTGRSPFSRDTVVKTILAHRSDTIPTIETGFPEDDEVNELFRRMVAKKPQDRFQSTNVLMEAIERVEQGGSIRDMGNQPAFVPPTPEAVSSKMVRDRSPLTKKNPTVATAFVERFDSRAEFEDLPEAIHVNFSSNSPSTHSHVSPQLATDSQRVEYITDDSILMPRHSEVIYIPDVIPRTRFGRVQSWLKADRSRMLMMWALIAICTSAIPLVGLILAWRTWRSANKDIADIKAGNRNPNSYGLTRIARFTTMFACILGIVLPIVWLSGGFNS